jgi:actin-related protein
MLEIVSDAILYVGHVGQPRAKHILGIPAEQQLQQSSSTASPMDYYRIYSPVIRNAFHLLGLDPNERRVIVLSDGGLYRNRAWQEALQRILLIDSKVPACCFHSSLQMVPTAFPPSPQKRQQDGMLIVQLAMNEVHCMAYALGIALENTYQVCSPEKKGIRYQYQMLNSSLSELAQKQNLLTVASHHGERTSLLVQALLQCIKACPRETRRAVVHNVVFVGVVADNSFGVRVAKDLRSFLQQQQESSTIGNNDNATQHPPQDHDSTPVEGWESTTCTPVNIRDMKDLGDHISVLQLGSLRPDLVAWLGASVWAMHWHGIDPNSVTFRWISL